jgi:hypothetical protein
MDTNSARYHAAQDAWRREYDAEQEEQEEQADAIRAEQEEYRRELAQILQEEE